MGEMEDSVFQPGFNRSVRVEVSPTALTEDTGALLLREVAEDLGFDDLVGQCLDHRDAAHVLYPLTELFRTRIFLLAQGYRDQDDADALRDDPAFRLAVSDRKSDRALLPAEGREPEGLASQPTLSRLQAMLASAYNRRRLACGLLTASRRRMLRAYGRRRVIILDVDSFPRETHGHQDGAAYNGHYKMTGYHPLIAITDTGDIVGVQLRPGNVHTANDVRRFLSPILAALKEDCEELWVRMDAGYADGKLLAWLRQRGVQFLTRLKNNAALRKRVARWREKTLADWAEAPSEDGQPREATREFWYRAKRWTRPERVVAVLVERNAGLGELLHKDFFLCTSLSRPKATSAGILKTYRQRGAAEGHIGEYVGVVRPSLSSVQRHRQGAPQRKRRVGMAENEVSLLLSALAYELMHAVRCALEAATGEGVSLRRLRERVLKVATAVVRHARRVHYRISETKAALWSALAGVLSGSRTLEARA
jgi:hypothetical protein